MAEQFDDGYLTSDHEAVVYDLDGTLVRLAVDWNLVAADVAQVLAEAALDAADLDLWDMIGFAERNGVGELVEETIAEHERAGARESRRLPFADHVDSVSVPAAVCSLNSEGACRIALEKHGLLDSVDVVVGRDSVAAHKPHPEPLLTAVEGLGSTPERTLFIGDSKRDEKTARRAGTPYVYVGDGPTEY